MSFLFSRDECFPTWWTTMPKKLPIITAGAPFHGAERLSGQSREFVVERSLQTLSEIMAVSMPELPSLFTAKATRFRLGRTALEKSGRMGSSKRAGNPCRTCCSWREGYRHNRTQRNRARSDREWVLRGPADSAGIGLSLTTRQRDETGRHS